jgi:hypothetical protein
MLPHLLNLGRFGISGGTSRKRVQRALRLQLQGTQALLPLPGTRRCEREPAEQSSQRPLALAISGGPPAHRLMPGRIHPGGRTPDANPDARLRSIKTAAVLATPDDHGIRRRKRVIPVRWHGPEAPQRRACGLLERLVRGLRLARPWLRPRQLRNHRPEPHDTGTTSSRGPGQLVVIVSADKLKLALRAIICTAMVLPHCPAADAGRDGQAVRLLHLVNIGRWHRRRSAWEAAGAGPHAPRAPAHGPG